MTETKRYLTNVTLRVARRALPADSKQGLASDFLGGRKSYRKAFSTLQGARTKRTAVRDLLSVEKESFWPRDSAAKAVSRQWFTNGLSRLEGSPSANTKDFLSELTGGWRQVCRPGRATSGTA